MTGATRRAAALLTALYGVAGAPADAASPRANPLRAARSWAYQLQNVDIDRLSESDYDVVVLDVSSRPGQPWQPRQIQKLKERAGRPRIVLAYISVGEAESYRPYWRPEWFRSPPDWLGPENPDWKGNFTVKYWHRDWQRELLRFGGMIDQAIGSGFDGVYLDRLDVYMDWGPTGRGEGHRAASARAMVSFVQRIATHARQVRSIPDFLVVGQNAPLLCADSTYVQLVDAVALEDLLYYRRGGRDGARRKPDYTRFILNALTPLRAIDRPVFVVDYLPSSAARRGYAKLAGPLGVVPYPAPSRALDQLP